MSGNTPSRKRQAGTRRAGILVDHDQQLVIVKFLALTVDEISKMPNSIIDSYIVVNIATTADTRIGPWNKGKHHINTTGAAG